ncbi:MAG: PEP-CTERM sorting domain-containing protein [Verrucomicrobia bacterium]|nr:PEP-CTERM sorting domain-containing protein [Verrucomicrobiota bacterium]
MKRLMAVCVGVVLCCALPGRGAVLIEDFENISDLNIQVGTGADSGAIVQNAGEAQVGSYAGELQYSLTTEQSFDYVRLYTDPLSVAITSGDTFKFYLNQPADPDSYLTIRLTTDTGGYYFKDYANGDGSWSQISLPFASMGVSGSPGTTLTEIRFEMVGDGSATATADSLLTDQWEIEAGGGPGPGGAVPEPSTAGLISVSVLLLSAFRRKRR